MALGALLALTACSREVRRGVDEDAANDIVVALYREGIAADKLRDESGTDSSNYRVEVAKSDLPRALSIVERAGLPRRAAQGIAEVFAEPSIVPSRSEDDARLAAALGGELSRSLASIDGVLDARVHLAPAAATLSLVDAPSRPASASVLITHEGAASPIAVENVQSLVASAVHGLAEESVSVVFVRGPAQTEPNVRIERVGPFSVVAESAAWMRVTFGLAIGVQALLAAALLVRLRRTKAFARTSDAA